MSETIPRPRPPPIHRPRPRRVRGRVGAARGAPARAHRPAYAAAHGHHRGDRRGGVDVRFANLAIDAAMGALADVERTMSRFSPTSDIGRANLAAVARPGRDQRRDGVRRRRGAALGGADGRRVRSRDRRGRDALGRHAPARAASGRTHRSARGAPAVPRDRGVARPATACCATTTPMPARPRRHREGPRGRPRRGRAARLGCPGGRQRRRRPVCAGHRAGWRRLAGRHPGSRGRPEDASRSPSPTPRSRRRARISSSSAGAASGSTT